MPDDHSPRRVSRPLLLFVLWLCLPMGTVHSEVPRTIHYQGKLVRPDGSPLTGQHTVTLRLYDAATGGTKLWEEQHPLVLAAVDNGVLSVVLGATVPFSDTITFNAPLWLTIEVDGGGEFTPRQPLSAVGYAINADQLDGLDSSTFVQLDANGALPAHAGTHQPGGSDALATASAVAVGSANSAGTSTSLARADHVHQGLHSLAVEGQSGIVGDATLQAGSNVTLTQSGSGITIAASGSGSVSCLPIGGSDPTGRSITFEMGTFGPSGMGGRADDLWPAPVAGTVNAFRAIVKQAPDDNDSWTVTLRRNDTNTALSCAITGDEQGCTASGNVSVSAGDRIGVRFVENGSADNTNGSAWSACFVPE